MSAIRVKICPACQQPSPTDAQWCVNCGHQFRTKFAPDQHPAPVRQTQSVYIANPPQSKERVQPRFTPRSFLYFTLICSFWLFVELGWIAFNWIGFIVILALLMPFYREMARMRERNWHSKHIWQFDLKAWLCAAYILLWVCILASNTPSDDISTDAAPSTPSAAAPQAPAMPRDYGPMGPIAALDPSPPSRMTLGEANRIDAEHIQRQIVPSGYPRYAYPGAPGGGGGYPGSDPQRIGGFSHASGFGGGASQGGSFAGGRRGF